MQSLKDRSPLAPGSAAELAELLSADDRPVEPIGLGSKRAIGRPVDAQGLMLDALSGVVDYRPAELVLTAQAATPLDEIDALLAGNGQRLAFEPPNLGPLLGTDRRASIGGVLAANLAGSRRLTAGAARDHLLGVAAVNGRGQSFRAGGKVVKNVTGYDLPKLLAGSWGTLAVMTEVTLKVVPRAEAETTLIVPDADLAAGVALMSRVLGGAHEVSSAGFDPWRGVALRLEGLAVSVAARLEGLLPELGGAGIETLEADASRSFWQQLAGAAGLADWPVVWRLSVPPSDAPRVIEAIAPERYQIDWGGGLIWAAFGTVDAERVRGSLREGHATLFKAPADTRTCRWQSPSPALADALERIRMAFDPDRRLNPGRMD